MDTCPKCQKAYPPGKEICPHCGLVFWKWAANRKHGAATTVEPEQENVELPEEVRNANLGYLVGWAAGFIPGVGIIVAIVHYFRDYHRLAFQALALGITALFLISVDSLLPQGIHRGNVYPLIRIFLIPLVLVYLLRKIEWPQNSPRSAPPDKDQPLSLARYLRHRAPWLGIDAFLILTAAVLLSLVPSVLEAYFVIFSIPIMMGIIGTVAIPVMFFLSVFGQAKRNLRWMDWMAGLMSCLFTLFVFIHGYNVAETQVKANMQRLIPALDDYRQKNGAYPKTLDLLDARFLPNGPRCYTYVNRPPYYAVREDGSYNMICGLFVFLRIDYSSATGKWEIYD